MIEKANTRVILAFIALVFVSLACAGGYSTTRRNFGNNGQVIVKADDVEAIASTSIEINEDFSWEDLSVSVSAEVDSGEAAIVVEGDGGQTIELSASAGSPGSASGSLQTDAFGEIDLSASGNAAGIVITIDYTNE